MPKISIIVPVYNVQDYIENCIKSILNQTFQDFELILVNDGSTDESSFICDEYSRKYRKIKIIHKENGGLSDARNVGIKNASGEYIGFIDSDDTIEVNMYEILYNLCIENKIDIATCKINSGKKNLKNEKNIRIYSNKEAISNTYQGDLSGYSVCNKLFKLTLFENVKFPIGRIYEDSSVLYKLYMKSNGVVYIDYPMYNYIYRQGSITRQSFSEKRFDIVDMYEEKYMYMYENFPEMCEKIKSMYYISLRNIMVDIVNEKTVIKNYKYIKKVSKLVRSQLKFIFENNLIRKQHKILAIFIAYIPIIPIAGYATKRQNNY